jgi:hypothetical protein
LCLGDAGTVERIEESPERRLPGLRVSMTAT